MLFFLYPFLHIINVTKIFISRLFPSEHSLVFHSSGSSSLSLCLKYLQVLLYAVGSFTHGRYIFAA